MKKLSRDEMKNLKGGSSYLPEYDSLSCLGECPDEGSSLGCPDGQKCYNVTCSDDPTQCENICY